MRILYSLKPLPVCRNLLVGLAAICCGLSTQGHRAALSYATEWQTDFRSKANWVNLLQLEGEINLNPEFRAVAKTISTCKTAADGIMSDLLAFSNIEEENIPLALSRLGVAFDKEYWGLFAGIGNVNDDFFATPLTSIYTNSSCGIFPTLSCNFSIANYPDAALGIEGHYDFDNVSINSALYNGKGSHRFAGENCVFACRPARDGIFNINAVNYHQHDNNYNIGIAVYHGHPGNQELGTQDFSPIQTSEKKTTKIACWLYAEQKIVRNLSFIAQYSHCGAVQDGCRDFAGVGIAWRQPKFDIACYSCYASFTDNHEWASELTFRYNLSGNLYIQPALHYVRNATDSGLIGLMRICYEL